MSYIWLFSRDPFRVLSSLKFATLSEFGVLQKYTWRYEFECKQFIWEVTPGNTNLQMGSEMKEGGQ